MDQRTLLQLAKTNGTPLIVVDHKALRENLAQFRKYLPRVQAYYAVKANADPAICAAAFDGDAESQLRLIDNHLKAKVRTPHGIKELTSARFGTSVRARAD